MLAAILGLSALWWLLCWKRTGSPWPLSPFNGALLLWGVSVMVGALVSAYPELTLPKLSGLLLGLVVWRFLVLLVGDRSRLWWAVVVLLGIGVGIAFVGFISVRWQTKVPGLGVFLAFLPQERLLLPGGPEAGVNANQLAGILVFFAPVVLALGYGRVRAVWDRSLLLRLLSWVGLSLSFTLTLGVLLLTQSRSGWIGGIAGILALFFLSGLAMERRWLSLSVLGSLIVILLGGTFLLVRMDPAHIVGLWETPGGVTTDLVGTLSLSGRMEIWSRAFYAIQDFAFTGCGLGTFREVVWVLYPLFTISPEFDIAHAHNIFLQVAVDTGIPGLVAYLALLGIAGYAGWRAARLRPEFRPLALGLLAGLVALHTYGLTDALAPGSKPAIVFWWALGLLAAMERMAREETELAMGYPETGAESLTTHP